MPAGPLETFADGSAQGLLDLTGRQLLLLGEGVQNSARATRTEGTRSNDSAGSGIVGPPWLPGGPSAWWLRTRRALTCWLSTIIPTQWGFIPDRTTTPGSRPTGRHPSLCSTTT